MPGIPAPDYNDKIVFICKNKRNVSQIQEYLAKLEASKNEDADIDETIQVLTGVFCFYIRQRTWKDSVPSNLSDGDSKDSSEASKRLLAEQKVNTWLHNAYKSYLHMLLDRLVSNPVSMLTCFKALLMLLKAQHSSQESVVKSDGSTSLNFPNEFFIGIVRQLLLARKHPADLSEHVESLFQQYDDLCFYCLKSIRMLLENQNLAGENPSAVGYIGKNTLHLLMMITDKDVDLDREIYLYIDHEENPDTTEITKHYKSHLSTAWMTFLSLSELPLVVRKKILVNLDSKIMPHLVDPKFLIDFLTDCYDAGGVSSLLALNGLFTLINQYNLDYPDFYTKLYNILDANVFCTKYKPRFFHLLDLFLSSTHLPSYLLCAFVKKLSRMTLLAPGEDIYMLLKFIKNLLIRHSSTRILIHRQSSNETGKGLEGDPYDYEESDPFKSNASKSCLWELESLRHHYSKEVLKLVLSFKKEFPIVEDDISQYLDNDFDGMISSQLDADITDEKPPPLNYETKDLLDFDQDMWCI